MKFADWFLLSLPGTAGTVSSVGTLKKKIKKKERKGKKHQVYLSAQEEDKRKLKISSVIVSGTVAAHSLLEQENVSSL